jgi:hypothetical protein
MAKKTFSKAEIYNFQLYLGVEPNFSNFFLRSLPNGQNASVVTGGGFFSHSKFRYSGRTEREILSESLQSLRQQSSENSSPTKRKASSVPATPSSPQDLIDLRKFTLKSPQI